MQVIVPTSLTSLITVIILCCLFYMCLTPPQVNFSFSCMWAISFLLLFLISRISSSVKKIATPTLALRSAGKAGTTFRDQQAWPRSARRDWWPALSCLLCARSLGQLHWCYCSSAVLGKLMPWTLVQCCYIRRDNASSKKLSTHSRSLVPKECIMLFSQSKYLQVCIEGQEMLEEQRILEELKNSGQNVL